MAPQAGLEPATLRLTAGCSAIELLRNMRRVAPNRTLILANRSFPPQHHSLHTLTDDPVDSEGRGGAAGRGERNVLAAPDNGDGHLLLAVSRKVIENPFYHVGSDAARSARVFSSHTRKFAAWLIGHLAPCIARHNECNPRPPRSNDALGDLRPGR